MPGSLALILHAHLPFVRHPEHAEFFEEDWLFEAITETYIPLLRMMQRLVAEGVPFRLAMSVTPPLCAMLQDELLCDRYLQYLDRSVALATSELERNREQPAVLELAQFYLESLTETRSYFLAQNCDLLGVFRELRDSGALEIVASAATHGLLPLLLESPEAVKAQIAVGCDVYREIFNDAPVGFWLPECAYAPGVEKILGEANIRWFALEARGLLLAQPRPRAAIFAPCFTPDGPAIFARDPVSSRDVWSAESGFPGDPAYRDFYRDVGFDHAAHAFAHSENQTPRFTGLKYYRVTGPNRPKEIYSRAAAAAVAEVHAEHFLNARLEQLAGLAEVMTDPLVVMPFDAELFGHWWFEGPLFLEAFIRKAGVADSLCLTTPAEFLATHQRLEVVAPAASSWGEDGYWSVWLDKTNAWIYPDLHRAARQMTTLARRHADAPTPAQDRALRQLARELLLAQSSDWAFLMKTGTAREYATRRIGEHLQRFNTLRAQLETGAIDDEFLRECETRDNLFPNLRWRHYV